MANECYLQKKPLDDILNMTEKKIFDVVQKKGGGDYVPVKQIVINVLEKVIAFAVKKKVAKEEVKILAAPLEVEEN